MLLTSIKHWPRLHQGNDKDDVFMAEGKKFGMIIQQW